MYKYSIASWIRLLLGSCLISSVSLLFCFREAGVGLSLSNKYLSYIPLHPMLSYR